MQIHVCNNDDQGNWTTEISRVEFEVDGEGALLLETRTMMPVRARVFDPSHSVMQLEIYGCSLKFNLVGTWTGNMKWNTIYMLDYYALGFLQVLQRSREWFALEGWSELVNKFENGDTITGKDFDLEEDVEPRVVNPNQLEIRF